LSIKKSISFTFGAQLINTCIAFVSSIVITRILGAEGRGANAIFSNSTAFAVLFFGFSINSTIPYFINSGKAKAGELMTTIIIFIFASTFFVYFSLVLLEYFGRLHWALPDTVQSFEYKLLFTGIYFTSLISSVLTNFLLTYKKFKLMATYSVLFQLLPLTIYLLLFFNVIPYNHAETFKTVVNITAILALASTLILTIMIFKILPVRPTKKLIPLTLIKQFILFSAMAYIGNVFQFFSYKLDFWIVDANYGKASLGVYSLAAQLSQLLWLLPQSLATVLYAYASSSSEEESLKTTLLLKKVAFYGTLIFAIVGLTLSYFFIPILYGKEFVPAIKLIAIFIIGIVPFSIPTVLASFFAARGLFKYSFYTAICVSIVTICCYIVVIPRYGVVGAAIASAFSYLCSTILFEYLVYKKFNVNPFTSLRLSKTIVSDATKYFKSKDQTFYESSIEEDPK